MCLHSFIAQTGQYGRKRTLPNQSVFLICVSGSLAHLFLCLSFFFFFFFLLFFLSLLPNTLFPSGYLSGSLLTIRVGHVSEA